MRRALVVCFFMLLSAAVPPTALAEQGGSHDRAYQAGVVSVGPYATCIVAPDSTVRCFGSNYYGVLGVTANTAVNAANPTPTTVVGVTGAVSVAVGYLQACAVLRTGSVQCWGSNYHGELGNSTNLRTYTPTLATTVTGLTTAVAVTVNEGYACALLASGTVECWGDNMLGQLGRTSNIGTDNPNPAPAAVPGIATAVAISAGSDFTCALRADGTAWCWGDNMAGQLGNPTGSGTSSPQPAPLPVTGLSDGVALTAGDSHACVLRAGGAVTCWGFNLYGQLGTATNSTTYAPNPTPTPVAGISDAAAVSAGTSHTCAVRTGGSVSCWGNNRFGQLGNGSGIGTEDAHPTPTEIAGLSPAAVADAGADDTCALLSDGGLSCWGANDEGQLGNAAIAGSDPTPERADTPPLAGQVADLSLTAAINGSPDVVLGAGAQVLLTLRNAGPDAATVGVAVHHGDGIAVTASTLSQGAVATSGPWDTWALGTVASGGTATALLTLRVGAAGVHALVAQVISSSAYDLDSKPANADPAEDDQAAVTVTARVRPDAFTTRATRVGHRLAVTTALLVTRVAPRDACRGRITVTVRKGSHRLAAGHPRLSLTRSGICQAKTTLTVSAKIRGPVVVTAALPRSDLLLATTSKPTTFHL